MKRQLTSRRYFQTINLTYYMQAFSLLLFSVVIFVLIYGADKSTAPAADIQWVYVLPVVLIIGLGSAWFLFRAMVNKIDPKARLQDKFPKYASALILRSALLELPGLLAGIVAYLTFEPFYLGGAVMIFLAFVLLRPTRQTIAEDLNLSPKERALIENPDAVVSEVN